MLWLGGYVRERRECEGLVGWVGLGLMDGWMDNKIMRIRFECSGGSRCFGYFSGSCGWGF